MGPLRGERGGSLGRRRKRLYCQGEKGEGLELRKAFSQSTQCNQIIKIFLFFLVKVALFKDEEEGLPPPFVKSRNSKKRREENFLSLLPVRRLPLFPFKRQQRIFARDSPTPLVIVDP